MRIFLMLYEIDLVQPRFNLFLNHINASHAFKETQFAVWVYLLLRNINVFAILAFINCEDTGDLKSGALVRVLNWRQKLCERKISWLRFMLQKLIKLKRWRRFFGGCVIFLVLSGITCIQRIRIWVLMMIRVWRHLNMNALNNGLLPLNRYILILRWSSPCLL